MKFPKLTHTIILLLFAILLVPTSSIRPMAGIGADASWHQALAMALQQKMFFGEDVIFRYGPLAFLQNGFLPERVHVVAQLLFDLYLLFNLLFVIHYALKKARIKWVAVVALIGMIVPWGFIADATFTLLFLFLFNLFHANENRRSFSLYNAVFIAALMFFIKVNFSLVVTILLYASLIYLWLSQRFSWRELLAVLITHLFLIYWGAYQLRVDIYNYLISSIHIIENFDDASGNIQLKPMIFYTIIGLALSITFFTLIVFFKNAKQVYKRQDYLFTFLMVFSAMYLSFKQQFTNLVPDNAMAYFLFIPPLLSLLWIFLRDSDAWFSRLVITSLVISTIAFQFLRYENSRTSKGYWEGFFPKEQVYFKAKYGGIENANKKAEPIMDALNIVKLHTPYGYVKSLTDNQFTTYFPKYNLENRTLPNSFLTKIGDQTIDILPSEVAYIFYNKLNYNPRPTIQSNQAVGAYLDNKNAVKINSKTAPMFILSQYLPAKDRYALWEETYTKLAFICNYKKTESASMPQFKALDNSKYYDSLSLYQKRQVKLKMSDTLVENRTLEFGKEFDLKPTKNILLIKTKLKYTASGAITRYLFQAPFVHCQLTFIDGTKAKFRAIITQFNDGVIINKKVLTNKALDAFYSSNGQEPNQVKSIKFEVKNSWSFDPKIDIEIREIEIK